MKKYECFCGFEANKKKEWNKHSDNFGHNVFIKLKLSTRLINFYLQHCKVINRWSGLMIIYCVTIHHFDIKLSFIEACLMGMGMGFLVI